LAQSNDTKLPNKLQQWTQAVVLPASECISPESDSPLSEYTERRVPGAVEVGHESWELRTETVDHAGSGYDQVSGQKEVNRACGS
jgi:hypothetical protein